MKKYLSIGAAVVAIAALVLVTAPAEAGPVHLDLNIGVPLPFFVQPGPVYVSPAPAYVQPSGVVVYGNPGYYSYGGYYGPQWRDHHEWHAQHWNGHDERHGDHDEHHGDHDGHDHRGAR